MPLRLVGLEAFQLSQQVSTGLHVAFEGHLEVAMQDGFVGGDGLAPPALDDRDLAPEHLVDGGREIA